MQKTVYDYITSEETRYKTVKVPIAEGYEWNMYDHVTTTTLYLNSRRKNAAAGEDLPYDNIILPKIKLQHRAVRIKLSEIEFFIDSEDEDYKSFLIRKWHERYGLTKHIAHELRRMSDTYTSYGGVLLENVRGGWGVTPFQRLAFCDQTDMLSGPICQKHQLSADQLLEYAGSGWGDPANGATRTLEQVIELAAKSSANQKQNTADPNGPKAQTPGNYIEVYDLEGSLPVRYVGEEADEYKYQHQIQVVTFYTDEKGEKQGITLFAKKKKPGRYKAKKRDDEDDSTYGRALGRGGVEELFEPQVWYNYSLIQKTELLDQISKIIYQTTDKSFQGRNNTSDTKTGDIVTTEDGKPLNPVNNTNNAPVVTVIDNALAMWNESAKDIASARDAISGEASTSGMPFREVALLNQENHSLHEDRKEALAEFLETEVYPDWVIPQMLKDVAAGAEFLSCLSLDEMSQIVDQVVTYEFNQSVIKKILSPLPQTDDLAQLFEALHKSTVYPEEAQALKDAYRQQFFKNNRKFIKILEKELSDLPVQCMVNISNDQKNLAVLTDKISTFFDKVAQILMVNPNFFTQHPEMAKWFNQIVEASGLSALNFGMKAALSAPQQGAAPTQPQAPALNPQQYAQPQIPGKDQATGQPAAVPGQY